MPDRSKIVAVVAPHSSAVDFLIAIGLVFSWNLRIRYIGKKELFRFPLGPAMYWLGGIAVDRQAPGGILDQVVDEFHRSDRILLGVAPEGTRTPGSRWKSGFYWIATRGNAAIVPVYLDWSRHVIGILPPFEPTDNPRADLAAIARLFLPYTRKDGLHIDPEAAVRESGSARPS